MSDFAQVALLRASESGVLAERGHHLGAVYLQGYNIECLLKRLHQVQGKPFPAAGREGHNLQNLWSSSGLTRGANGHAAEFIEVWSTNLRYEHELPDGIDAVNLLDGAKALAGRVQSRIRSYEIAKNKRKRRARS